MDESAYWHVKLPVKPSGMPVFKHRIVPFLLLLTLLLSCDFSPSSLVTDEPGDQPMTLATTISSDVATITRVPDLPTYSPDDRVIVTATAHYGYTFTGWSGDVTSSDSTVVVVMNSSKTLYANFRNSAGAPLYSLVTSSPNGSVTLSPEGGLYDSGTTVHAYPRPGYGYTFAKWSGAANSTEELVSLVITGNAYLQADFSLDANAEFATITIDPAPSGGEVLLDPPGIVSGTMHRYEPGTAVTVAAVPDTGYELSSWDKDFSSTPVGNQSFTVTVDSSYTLSATFSKAPDGVHWTELNSGNKNGLIAIIKADNKLVIAGNNGTILTSTDGEEWTLRETGVTTCLNCVIWTGNLFVCVGDSSTILTSTDAVTWERRYSATRDHLQSVVWTGKQFIAGGGYMQNSASTYGCILTSDDGITWKKTYSSWGICYSIAWNGELLVGSSYDFNFTTVSDNSRSYLLTSTDGLDWDMVDTYIPLEVSFTSIIWTGKQFAAIGGSRSSDAFSSAYVSTNGTTWVKNRISTRNFMNSVTWTGNTLVAVGKKGDIFYSTSGSSWKQATSGTTSDIYGVTWSGDKLYAVGYGGLLLRSP